jgi:glycosyltransferase involved in cell wall biosynthesis
VTSNLISVITPAYKPEPAYLTAAYESLASQELPPGWRWEWVVQEDGHTHHARDILPADDDRIVFGGERHGGVAIARNLALATAKGSLIKNLDQDDILTAGTLSRDIRNLSSAPEIRWTTSRVLDLMPDGSTVGFPSDPPGGKLAPGVVFDHWRTHNYRLPVHPTSICVERSFVVAIGGWMASPGSDDTGMLIAASLLSHGYFEPEVGLLYRKWDGQETAKPAHFQPSEWNLRMSLIEDRGRQIQALGLALGSTRPASPRSEHYAA